MAVSRVSIGGGKKESLAQLVARYKYLADPKIINQGLMIFTLREDIKLYNMLISDSQHPKDTGLLKESWVPPARKLTFKETGNMFEKTTDITATANFRFYKDSFASGKFNVYVLNTATVGEQARRKNQGISHRKKKLSGRHNLKRYLPWVDARTKFYTKKLRVVRQGIDKDWKDFVNAYVHDRLGGL